MTKLVNYFHKIESGVIKRMICSKIIGGQYTAENLRDRSVVLVTGRESPAMLQRLMTNDLSKLDDDKCKSIFTTFLNKKGKVLFDAIVYKYGDNYLLDVDSKSLQHFEIHFKIHSGGGYVKLKNLEDKLCVWNVVGMGEAEKERLKTLDLGDHIVAALDPRLDQLGIRIIGSKKLDMLDVLKNCGIPADRAPRNQHQLLRYELGVPQGLSEIPPGRCSPTEMNADYLSAFSLKKEFIGFCPDAEDTAKRFLPLRFPSNVEDTLKVNTPLLDEKGIKKSPIGYLRGVKKNVGLGLVGVNEALKSSLVRICNNNMRLMVNCYKPYWWPN